MPIAITQRVLSVRPDRPQGAALRFVPITGPSHEEPRYAVLTQDNLGSVKITEVSQGGSVPELQVTNDLDTSVYLMDGQELVGAKQNRILNTDVLIAAKSTVIIPVSCVEQGRWSYQSNAFSPGKAASHRIRSGKAERVRRSLALNGTHDADQGAVWSEVSASLASNDIRSNTSALKDAYDARKNDLDTFRKRLQLPVEAVGIAAFEQDRFLGMDLFDRHSTLAYFWDALIDGYALERVELATSMGVNDIEGQADMGIARDVLTRVSAATWQQHRTPGEGADWRLDNEGYAGSALVWQEKVAVHLQVFPKVAAEPAQPTRPFRARVHRPYNRGQGPSV